MALLEVNWQPTRRDLRQFAVVLFVAAQLLALWLHYRFRWNAIAFLVLSAGIVAMVVGILRPQWLRIAFVVWMLAAYPLGWVMSHVLLALIYYGLVTPIGIYLRWRGRDALQLKPRPNATTYWVTRSNSPPSSHYFRQF